MAALIERLLDRARLRDLADWLVLGIAISLPWSTSATGLFIVLWLVALLPTLDRVMLRESLSTSAGAIPVAFVVLALIGMSWADAPFLDRIGGFRSFIRLLAIPLLFVQFNRSERGWLIVGGYAASCVALLALSWTFKLVPGVQGKWGVAVGVPVKEYIVQSGEFLLCAFGLVHVAITEWEKQRYAPAVAAALLGLTFLANVFFVATSRTSVIVYAAFALLLGWQRLGRNGAVCTLLAGTALFSGAWISSPYLRSRVISVADEVNRYENEGAETSSGYRLEFWKKSIRFISTAPIIGHGTGSTEELFRRASADRTGIAAAVTSNPHNQFLLIGVELGLIGLAFLVALWVAHTDLFLGHGLAGRIGIAVVVQNVISSFFNAQLFYFTPGWTYVFGVGVIGGLVMRRASAHGVGGWAEGQKSRGRE